MQFAFNPRTSKVVETTSLLIISVGNFTKYYTLLNVIFYNVIFYKHHIQILLVNKIKIFLLSFICKSN